MNFVLNTYIRLAALPLGKRIFSKLVCVKAPYFKSIKPLFRELRPGYCEITIKKRRLVENHLRSVHAIAMANMCELCAGTMMEVTIPGTVRWIPKTMTVEYLKMAKTDLKGQCELAAGDFNKEGDVPVTVHVTDVNGVEVLRAVIVMYVSPKKKSD